MDFTGLLIKAGNNILSTATSARDEALNRVKGWINNKSQDSWTAIPDDQYPEGIPKPGTPVDESTWPNPVNIPPNRALLDTISFAEGTWQPDTQKPGYNLAYNFNEIDTTKPHPDIVFKGSRINSAASGAYQFMPWTWMGVHKGENLPMSPGNQDDAALQLAIGRGWNPDQGFKGQAHKLSEEWASFPTLSGAGAYPGQGPRAGDGKLGKLDNFYNQRLAFYQNKR